MAARVEEIEQAIFIQLARPSVAAFLFNPLNEVIWCSGVQSVRPSCEGRLVPGMQVERQVKALLRTFSLVYQVTAVQGDAGAELRVLRPWDLLLRYDLGAEQSGTRVTLHAELSTRDLFKLPGSLLCSRITRALRRDLLLLKRHLEHASWTVR